MTRALRSVSSEKGRDPRDFAIVAYGGSGPVHAAGLADELGVRTVVVPPVAGLFSAVGLLFARPEFHDVRTCHLDVDAVAATGRRARRRDAREPRRVVPRRAGGVGARPRSSATAARAGRSRSRCRTTLVRSVRPCPTSRRSGRGSRTSTSGSTACAASRARRSRSARCASPRSAWRRSPTRSPSTERARRAHVEQRCTLDDKARRGAGPRPRLDRRCARSPGRCSSTSTTRRSSSRPAGPCGATRRPRA